MNKEGKLIWITGLSGSGKTTIAENLYRILKKDNKNYVHLAKINFVSLAISTCLLIN